MQSPLYLAFSRKGKDLGLQRFALSAGQPCMDPSQNALATEYKPSYKYENALSEGCKVDETTK